MSSYIHWYRGIRLLTLRSTMPAEDHWRHASMNADRSEVGLHVLKLFQVPQ